MCGCVCVCGVCVCVEGVFVFMWVGEEGMEYHIKRRKKYSHKAKIFPFHKSGSTVVKVLCYKSESRWFDSSWCQWIFHWHKILPIALRPTQPLKEMSTRSMSWG